MNVWDVYDNRISVSGRNRREAQLRRERRAVASKAKENLSYQTVTVYDPEHGYNILLEEMSSAAIQKNAAVIDSDTATKKTMILMPGDDVPNGSLVFWMDSYWLVTGKDINATVCVRATLHQCNHLLRWVSEDDVICEQWSIVEDSTKYMTGEMEDRNFVVTRGDSRVYLTLSRNAETVKLGRKNRFIVDDEDAPVPMAYSLTKPLKTGAVYDGYGVFKFILQEGVTTDDDNLTLHIADYYKHFPRVVTVGEEGGVVIDTDRVSEETGRRVWL